MKQRGGEVIRVKKKSVSLVVIGKNSEDSLRRIYTQERISSFASTFCELIYVDSRSDDQSIAFMKSRGFETYIISEGSALSAACGRRCGTLVSKGDYVLYLDSDMELNGLEYIFDLIDKAEDSDFIGLVGKVIDNYPDGTCRERKRKDDLVAVSFGGFVIINRNEVISAGNWNHNLIANEELDLHARFYRNKKKIMFSDKISVQHYTEVSSPVHEFLSVYIPIRPSRYGALGKVLRSQSDFLHCVSILSMQREILFLLLPILALISLDPLLVGLSLALYFYLVGKRRSYKYALIVPGLLLSAAYGYFLKPCRKSAEFEKA